MSAAGLLAEGVEVVRDGASILRAAELSVEPGRLLGVIGPNGAGKTTLLRVVLGLERPAAGRVRLDGRPLAALAPRERARRVAYVPQGAPVHWPLAVERVVALGRHPHRAPWAREGDRDREAVARAMRQTDVEHLAGRTVASLSAGERARVALARALAGEPRYLLADEPVAALDPAHALAAMDLVRGLARGGVGVAVVLHDLALAVRFCDRLALMAGGRTVAAGPPAAVLDDANAARVFAVRLHRGEHAGEPVVVPWARL